jgi:MOSC domain-containing protein YiiM
LSDLPSVSTAPLIWIGLRPARRAAVNAVIEAQIDSDRGLVGDHAGRNADRRVTLITTAEIDAVGQRLGRVIDPAELRRNLLLDTAKVFLRAGQRYVAGEVILEISGPCAPCGRMREVLGEAGFQAMRGDGGMTARVIRGGWLRVGERFMPLQRDLFE